MSLRLAAALDGALYNDRWEVQGELPQLTDRDTAPVDGASDSDEEVAPPEDLEGAGEESTAGVILGKRFTEAQRSILLEAFAQQGKVRFYKLSG